MLPSQEIYQQLHRYYGTPPTWSANPYQVMMESILVQNTAWNNVLKTRLAIGERYDPRFVEVCSQQELQELISSCGFWRAKATAIKALTAWLVQYEYDFSRVKQIPMADLRRELLAIRGIGEETADVILTFALVKASFVIDTYTRRFLQRMGYCFASDAERRAFLADGIEPDAAVFGRYHWLLLDHGKKHCKKQPRCNGCPFSSVCANTPVPLATAGCGRDQ